MITLSDTAIAKVGELLTEEDEDGLALRVAVRSGGCAGLNYEMYFDTEKTDDDVSQTFGEFTVVVDAVSAGLLTDAKLDYLAGLGQSGFKSVNKNAQ